MGSSLQRKQKKHSEHAERLGSFEVSAWRWRPYDIIHQDITEHSLPLTVS